MKKTVLISILPLAVVFCFGCSDSASEPTFLAPPVDAKQAYKAYSIDERPYREFQDRHIKDLNEFIEAFPLADYEVHKVPKLGKIFLDGIEDTIKNLLKNGQAWESSSIELVKRYARVGTTVVDLGAHIGTITIPASRIVGKTGKVISFEPQPKIFRELNHNLMLNGRKNVLTFRNAAGKEPGVVQLRSFMPGNEGGTSLNDPSPENGACADVIALDSLHLTNVSFIKIDVEGWEELALLGAKTTILTNKPVMLIEITENVERTLFFIKDLGYDVNRIESSDNYLAIPDSSFQSK